LSTALTMESAKRRRSPGRLVVWGLGDGGSAFASHFDSTSVRDSRRGLTSRTHVEDSRRGLTWRRPHCQLCWQWERNFL